MAAPGLNRRRWLATLGSAAAVAAVSRPYLSRAADRPLITHGVQSGDVSTDSGIVWARADRAARMMVEVSTTDSFTTIVGGASVDALPDSDFTAKTLLQGLPAGQDIFYRIRFADIGSPTILGEPVTGRFRTAPADRRTRVVRLVGRHRGTGMGHRSRRAAACACTRRCAATGPTSSSIAATRSTPTRRSPPK